MTHKNAESDESIDLRSHRGIQMSRRKGGKTSARARASRQVAPAQALVMPEGVLAGCTLLLCFR